MKNAESTHKRFCDSQNLAKFYKNAESSADSANFYKFRTFK
ncbi:hypothetical protein [Helicobacter sp. 23-1045]